jgi:hypothetical protein
MPKPGPGELPHFESEEEELRFWDENHPADWIEGPADVIVRLKRRPKKPRKPARGAPTLSAGSQRSGRRPRMEPQE